MKDILRGMIYAGLFAVPFLTLYVSDLSFFPFITGKNFWFRIIVEAVFAAYLILALLDKSFRPRFSWLLVTFGTLMIVMLLATLNAENFTTAFWSNFERMDGYITLLHVFAYFLVMGSVFKSTRVWNYFFITTVTVATVVAIQGVGQFLSNAGRIDSTLGNAAYMAVYMLFHIFILALLFVRTKNIGYRLLLGVLAVLFVFVLLQTGTRGTAIGLVVGALATAVYLAVFSVRQAPALRRYALAVCVGLVILIGGFYLIRDTAFVQNNPSMARIANIDLKQDLQIRTIIWGMSMEGIKERPLLGWGNGNFNYVFNQQYDPRLYAQEQWFDRVHNIAFDWLIAGGLLGFLAYVSVFLSIFYYLVLKAWRGDDSFPLLERGIIFGLIIGYITHNLVVFDNIISYIFFAVILALLYSRYSVEWPALQRVNVSEVVVNQIIAPVTSLALVLVIYFVNVPSMLAADGLINTLRTPDPSARLVGFEKLLTLKSFGHQEIVEQLAQQTMSIVSSNQPIDPAVVDEYKSVTDQALQQMIANKPNDARLYVFLSGYYRVIGDNTKSAEALAVARTLSPHKQSIILQQGDIAGVRGDNEAALGFFKEAYELDKTNNEARGYYYLYLIKNGELETAQTVRDEEPTFNDYLIKSDLALDYLNRVKAYDTLAELYEQRLAATEGTAQDWINLTLTYYQISQSASTTDKAKQTEYLNRAITTVTRAGEVLPSFSTTAKCVANNLKTGKAPGVGCSA